MTIATNRFNPDYAVAPGSILEERLEAQRLSQAEFARRCGRSSKLISEIISGKAPIEPRTALQFQKVLGVDASIWLGIETDYRLFLARRTEAEQAKLKEKWISSFPIKELVELNVISEPSSISDALDGLLTFFGVGSIDGWEARYRQWGIAYRHSPKFKSSEESLASWLRLGETQALGLDCDEFDASRFRSVMGEVRKLTREPIEHAVVRTEELCRAAGVAFALVPPLSKIAVSGAAWWISPTRAIIQLSARHKSDDHFWFSFFHEAAHILLHSKRRVFIDGTSVGDTDIEDEANAWAANALVNRTAWHAFVSRKPRNKSEVCAFADHQGIAPGIVVGMLQHEGHIPWSHFNGLKVRYEWTEDSV